MYCINCGTLNSDNASHCTNCGAQLHSDQNDINKTTVLSSNEQPIYNMQQTSYDGSSFASAENEYIPEIKPMPDKDPGKGFGIAALILGIVSLVFSFGACCCGYFTSGFGAICFLALPIVGIVLGAIGSKKSKEADFKNAMAKTGLILSIISLVIIILIVVLFLLFGAALLGLVGMTSFATVPALGSSSYYY